MKRTLTGFAAASMVLGTFAPMALASTASSPNYNHRDIVVGSYSVSANGIAGTDPWTGGSTEFMPVWYLEQGLKSLGYTATWDGTTQKLSITTPDGSTTGLTAVTPGTKGVVFYINGVPVVNAPHSLVANDPATKKPTAFLPIYYFVEALKMIGFTSSYNGTAGTWTVTPPAPAKPAAVTTGIQGVVDNASGTAVAGATVKVGNNTATTDSKGYYEIAATPGIDQVTVTKAGYFSGMESVVVSNNQMTGANFLTTSGTALMPVNVADLSATVTVDNTQSGAPVAGATVTLETAGGTALATGMTDGSGVITFANTGATGTHFMKYGQTVNELEASTSYKVVVTDGFNSGNTTAAYHEADVTMTTSASSPTSNEAVGLTPVKMADVSATVGWNTNDAAVAAGTMVTATLLSATGTTIMTTSVAFTSGATSLTEDFGNLSIPSGDYVLEINDGVNAIEYKGVTVTEGVNSDTSITVNPAQQLNVNPEYSQYPTGETPSGSVTVTATEMINGHAITVGTQTGTVSGVTVGAGTVFEAPVTLNRLDAGSYTLSASGSYVLGSPSANYTVQAGTVGTVNVSMLPAADLSETVNVSSVPAYSSLPVTIEVKNSAGTVVASSTTNVVNNTSASAAGTANVDLQVPQGTYTVTVSAPGYQTSTTSNLSLTDFVTTSETANLTAVTGTALSGYVRYSGSDALVAGGTVSVYTLTDTFVSSTTINGNGEYSFGSLPAGSYELVARGPGMFDTKAVAVSITQGTNTDPIWVTKGGMAADYVTVLNGNGSLYTGSTSGLVAQDAWYDPNSTIAGQPGEFTYSGTNYFGLSGTAQPGVFETMGLSAGTYTVSFSGTTTHFTVGTDSTTQETLQLPKTAVNGATYNVQGVLMSSGDTEIVAVNSQGQTVATEQVNGGPFTIALPDGTYTIYAVESDFYVAAAQNVVVNNTPVTLSSFTLLPAQQ